MPEYRDIADMEEDNRIASIGLVALERPGKEIAFITDNEPGKAERYIEKLAQRFPSLVVVKRFDGPTPGTVSVIITRPLQEEP